MSCYMVMVGRARPRGDERGQAVVGMAPAR